MTSDLRKLLIEARAWMVANEKHAGVCPTQVMGAWGRCRCGFVSIIGRIDAALAEPVEPVADCGEAGHPYHCGTAQCLPSARNAAAIEKMPLP